MKRLTQSPEFIEQALRKTRERGNRTQASVAAELNISLSTLNRLLKYPMRERNLSPHGFDFSDFLFAS
jgi:hypothetical protein